MAAFADLPFHRLGTHRRRRVRRACEPGNLSAGVDHQQEHLLEQVQHLVLVPGDPAEEHAPGITSRGDYLFDPGAAPDPAVSAPPGVARAGGLIGSRSGVVFPESQVICINSDQAAP